MSLSGGHILLIWRKSMKNMKTIQQGFTLIELMIVVAIIGILAAVAIPAYTDYTVRSQVTEGLTLTKEVKVAVGEYRADRGRLPATHASASLPLASSITGNYVESVSWDGTGGITVTYGNKANAVINAATITMAAAIPGGNVTSSSPITWVCGNAPLPTVPANMAYVGTTTPTVTGGMENKFMPSACRP